MGGSSKGGGQTIGYWYDMDVLATLCHGKVDENTDFELVELRFGDRTGWTGTVSSSQTISVYQQELFGGEKREGGVRGQIDVMVGTLDQPVNEFLGTSMRLSGITGGVPAYRGEFSLFFRGVAGVDPEFASSGIFVPVRTNPSYSPLTGIFGKPVPPPRAFRWSAMNPYFKAFKVRLRRFWKGWYASKARIGNFANPAHIIYECLTNAEWGMGYPQADMDDTRFRAFADKLFDEGFGLGLVWRQQTSIQDFIILVNQHVNAVLNQDRNTGKIFPRLIRNDYDVATLLELNPSNSVLESYSRPGFGETVNEITIRYVTTEGQDDSVTVQDLANINSQGQVISQVIEMPGIHDPALAARIAQRELESRSRPICKVTVVTNRIAFNLYEGEVFKFSWPEHGIQQMICRVVNVNLGNLQDNRITIEAVEDVFGLPLASFVSPQSGGWVDPSNPPAPSPYRYLTETPFYDLARLLSPVEITSITNIDTFLDVFATAPSRDALDYNLWTGPFVGNVSQRGIGSHSPATTLTAPLVKQEFSVLSVANANNIASALTRENVYLVVNNEYMLLTNYDVVANTLTVSRGVLDTVPAEHASGSIVMLGDNFIGRDKVNYVPGENIKVRVQTKTSRGVLDITTTPENVYSFVGRQAKPYPPGRLRINGQLYPTWVNGLVTITFATRNRLTQTANIIAQDVTSISPESGQTSRVKFIGENNVTLSDLLTTSTTISLSAVDELNSNVVSYSALRDLASPSLGISQAIIEPNMRYVNRSPVEGGWMTTTWGIGANESQGLTGTFLDNTTNVITTRNNPSFASTRRVTMFTLKTGLYVSVYQVDATGISSFDPYVGYAIQALSNASALNNTALDAGNTRTRIRDRRLNARSQVFISNRSTVITYQSNDFWSRRQLGRHQFILNSMSKDAVMTGPAALTSVVVSDIYHGRSEQFDNATQSYMGATSPSYSSRIDLQYPFTYEAYSQVAVAFGNLIYIPRGVVSNSFSTSGKIVDITNVLSSHITFTTAMDEVTSLYSVTLDGAFTFIADRTGLVFADEVNATTGVEIVNSTIRTVNSTTGVQGPVIATIPSSVKVIRVVGDPSTETFYVLGDNRKVYRYDLAGTLLAEIQLPLYAAVSGSPIYQWMTGISGRFSMNVTSGYVYIFNRAVETNNPGSFRIEKDLSSYSFVSPNLIEMNIGTRLENAISRYNDTFIYAGRLLDEQVVGTQLSTAPTPRINDRLTIEVSSERTDGTISFQKHSHVVMRKGWGMRWGRSWGGG